MKDVLEIRVNIKAMRVGSVHKLKNKKKMRLYNVTTGFATRRIRYPLVRNTFVTCFFVFWHVRDMLFSVSHRK